MVTAEDGTTREYTVSVVLGGFASLEVTTPADKLYYYLDETVELAGLEVTGTWLDGSTVTYGPTDVDSIPSLSSVGPQTVTITKEGRTASFDIYVNPSTEKFAIGYPNGFKVPIFNLDERTHQTSTVHTGYDYDNKTYDFILSQHGTPDHNGQTGWVGTGPDTTVKAYPREIVISVPVGSGTNTDGYGTIEWKIDGKTYQSYTDTNDTASPDNDYGDDDDYTATNNIITIKAEDWAYEQTHVITFTGIKDSVKYSRNITFTVVY